MAKNLIKSSLTLFLYILHNPLNFLITKTLNRTLAIQILKLQDQMVNCFSFRYLKINIKGNNLPNSVFLADFL